MSEPVIACPTCPEGWRSPAQPTCQACQETRDWIAMRNELDRMTADRNYHADLAESWKAQFHSASAAASEYSEFWEQHSGEFDQFGNYIPYSQIDGDLRAAKAEIERLKALSLPQAQNESGQPP